MVKRVGRSCPKCVQERAQPATQLMGDLPRERLAAFEPAFTNTAVDYFGPFVVSYGRGRTIKRYGVLFTCLTSRAVHLDLAQPLSTEDIMLAFRRFVAAQRRPSKIFSDNGTNFVGPRRSSLRRSEVLEKTRSYTPDVLWRVWIGSFNCRPHRTSEELTRAWSGTQNWRSTECWDLKEPAPAIQQRSSELYFMKPPASSTADR